MTCTTNFNIQTVFSNLVKERAQQLFTTMNEEIETRLSEEIKVINNMGLAAEMLTLMKIVQQIQQDLQIQPQHTIGILAGSFVAYCLGFEPTSPLVSKAELNPLSFRPPLHLTLVYESTERNSAVAWLRESGYKMSTYLGQPMLKLPNMRVAIQRSSAVNGGTTKENK